MIRQAAVMPAAAGGGNIMDYVKQNPMIALVTSLVIGVILYFVFKNYIEPLFSTKYKPNTEHESSDASESKQATIMLFYADWCPHCKIAKPAWEDVKREYDGKVVNGYKVTFSEINCTDESAEVESKMNEYGIEGFPTIKMVKDGQIIEFDAKPTKETIKQFINTVL